MLNTKRSRIRAVAAVGMAAVAATVAAVTFQANAAEVAAPAAVGPDARAVAVPRLIATAIKPPAGSKPIGAYVVTSGTQTYTCTGGVFTGASVPEAQLVGTGGRVHHFGGPSWQSTRDNSLVTATKVAENPRAGTIPELLLQIKTSTGSGVLGKATYISRLLTSGGTAPAGACTDSAKKAVPYGAVYVFWKN
jgi:Protein of unknown function (DUF3455)